MEDHAAVGAAKIKTTLRLSVQVPLEYNAVGRVDFSGYAVGLCGEAQG
jgi:hypothetical protein